jgi:hypothetical protein
MDRQSSIQVAQDSSTLAVVTDNPPYIIEREIIL